MNINYEFDTIAAIATPLGFGGVGVIRISGENAFAIVNKMFSKTVNTAGKIYHGWILDGDKKVDETIVLPFKAPNSFTGEDVVEIQCHGGVNVVNKILSLSLENGSRMAEKGEFTKRAFLNKKIDLSQAEAVLDIIHAQTTEFAQKSAQNLSGVLAKKVEEIKSDIFELLSKIIAAVDFPEDVQEPEYSYLEKELFNIIEKIDAILKTSSASNAFRQGIKIAIVGTVNVGKSSLFNTLLNLDRAIVTDIAGTTRDVIQETVNISGLPATLIDTAGIREDGNIDTVESIGINYSKQSIQDADLILFLYDSSKGMQDEDLNIYNLITDKPHIKIATKSDIATNQDDDSLYISTLQNKNIDILKNEIKSKIISKDLSELEFTTNKRQQDCLSKAKLSLQKALEAVQIMQIQDLISIDIKNALLCVEEITGEVITDAILDNIFENFCIGK